MFSILTDSGCDLSAEMLRRLDIKCIPLKLNYPDRSLDIYPDERTICLHDFYRSMRDGETPKTAAATVEQWMQSAREELQAGNDVIIAPFSSGLSSTFQTAVMAANELRTEFPKRTVYVSDTRCASLGLGLLLYDAANLRISGADLTKTIVFLETRAPQICHWFTVDNLQYLRRGGRISGAAALAGTVLGIKPILHMDDEGHLAAVGKKRGRRASLEALADQLAELAVEPETQTIFISHGDCEADAKLLEQYIRERVSISGCCIHTIGPVIGAHSGPGTVSVFFYGRQR